MPGGHCDASSQLVRRGRIPDSRWRIWIGVLLRDLRRSVLLEMLVLRFKVIHALILAAVDADFDLHGLHVTCPVCVALKVLDAGQPPRTTPSR